MMPLRLAFDLDGTLADMDSRVCQMAGELFGPPNGSIAAAAGSAAGGGRPGLEAFGLSARQQTTLWTAIERTPDFWTTLLETEPGIVARVAQAAQDRRWEVLFITTRPSTAGETTQRQTQKWLEAYGFDRPSVFVVTGSRGKVASALTLDAVVDDRPEMALDVAMESQAKAILVSPEGPGVLPPAGTRLGVKVVPSISDALATLEWLDDLRAEPGVVQSIKRLFQAGVVGRAR